MGSRNGDSRGDLSTKKTVSPANANDTAVRLQKHSCVSVNQNNSDSSGSSSDDDDDSDGEIEDKAEEPSPPKLTPEERRQIVTERRRKLFAKRTVGEKFESARQRYFIRKMKRQELKDMKALVGL